MTRTPKSSRQSPDVAEREDPRAEAIGRSWSRSGVPAIYRDVRPAKKPTGWAYITGPVGSGKTYGAVSMLRRFLEDSARELAPGFWSVPTVEFVTASGYLASVKAGFDGDDRSGVYRSCACLVVDDLGQEVPTAWACDQLFELVNHRYNADLPTIVTSQFGVGAIASRLAKNGGREQAEAIASRLMGRCHAYRLEGTDRRLA